MYKCLTLCSQVRYVTEQVPGGKLTMPEEYLHLDGQNPEMTKKVYSLFFPQRKIGYILYTSPGHANMTLPEKSLDQSSCFSFIQATWNFIAR